MLEKILRGMRFAVFLGLDSVCWLVPGSRQRAALTLRLDAIGDFFLWLQTGATEVALYARRRADRSALLANHVWADYARTLGLWDEVIAVDPRRLMRSPLYRLRLMLNVRRLHPSLLIQPRSARVFLQEDAIARVSGAAERIGNSGTLLNIGPLLRRFGDRYYTRILRTGAETQVHDGLRNVEFARQLTGTQPGACTLQRDRAVDSNVVVVAVGAGDPGRVWPPERLADLIKRIRRTQPSFDIVLVGSKADEPIAKDVERRSGERLINKVGATTLADLVEIIGSARVLICNESSAFHIGMALDVDTICFLGGGHFGLYAPYPRGDGARRAKVHVLNVPMPCYHCNWKCRFDRAPSGAWPCVDQIPVELAASAFDAIIASGRERAAAERLSLARISEGARRSSCRT